jgi:Family of unknown function (DUF5681)
LQKRDYVVGWGRPPKSTQFPPGKSGNPSGRPRAKKDQVTMFREALEQKIQIEERGVKRSVTVLEAVIKRFTALALRGDLKAIKLLLEFKMAIPEAAATPQIDNNVSHEEILRIYQSTMRQVR